jgi:hypothetical protein
MENEKLFNRWILSEEKTGIKKYIPYVNQSLNSLNSYFLELKKEGNFVEVAKNGEAHGNFNFEGNLLYLHYKDSYKDKIFAVTKLNNDELILLER